MMQTAAPASFESLFTPLANSAFGVAVRFTGNGADAEDLVQEAALQAFRGFDSFEPGTNFKAWFFKILTNCYFSRRRREKSRPVTADLDDGPIVLQAAVPVLERDTVESLAARILAEEHRIYPEAIGIVLDGRWRLDGRRFLPLS